MLLREPPTYQPIAPNNPATAVRRYQSWRAEHRQAAIADYRMALELDPSNAAFTEDLARLEQTH